MKIVNFMMNEFVYLKGRAKFLHFILFFKYVLNPSSEKIRRIIKLGVSIVCFSTLSFLSNQTIIP